MERIVNKLTPVKPPVQTSAISPKSGAENGIRAIKCDIYSRCVGYYRPISSWNTGKRQEYDDRHPLSLAEISPDLIDNPESERKSKAG